MKWETLYLNSTAPCGGGGGAGPEGPGWQLTCAVLIWELCAGTTVPVLTPPLLGKLLLLPPVGTLPAAGLRLGGLVLPLPHSILVLG